MMRKNALSSPACFSGTVCLAFFSGVMCHELIQEKRYCDEIVTLPCYIQGRGFRSLKEAQGDNLLHCTIQR